MFNVLNFLIARRKRQGHVHGFTTQSMTRPKVKINQQRSSDNQPTTHNTATDIPSPSTKHTGHNPLSKATINCTDVNVNAMNPVSIPDQECPVITPDKIERFQTVMTTSQMVNSDRECE